MRGSGRHLQEGIIFSERGRNYSSLAKNLLDYVSTIYEHGFTNLWNEHLAYLFIDRDGPVHE
jgi:hypothetical protein